MRKSKLLKPNKSMEKEKIKIFLESFDKKRDRTIVVIDYGNVDKWKESLGWKIGINELAQLIKNFSFGKMFLRRFYYGSDYGKDEKSQTLTLWSKAMMEKAKMNRFEIIDKRVKYIHNQNNKYGFDKKCNLDVEMSIDLVKEKDNYDDIVLFSGDGDLVYAIKYLKENYNKNCIVFCARDHISREIIDAKKNKIIEEILFVEDFEYRLNKDRF